MHRRRFSWPLVTTTALVVAWLVSSTDLGQRLEYEFADIGTAMLLHEVDSDVVIVGIDAKSIAALNEWPWPRRVHADLIERLAPAAPARLFLDIDFSSPAAAADDERLERALAGWPGAPVILPAFYQYASPAQHELRLTVPLQRFLTHVSVGSVNLRPSTDGLVRSVQGSWPLADGSLPAVPVLLNGHQNNQDAEIRLDYTIDPESFRYLSYSDVVAGHVPAEYFAGRTVFVGATAIELGDTVPVPVHRALPGVVVQALAYQSVRDGLHRDIPAGFLGALLLAWTAAMAFLFCRGSWRSNIGILIFSLGVIAAQSLAAWAIMKLAVPFVPFGLAAITAWVLATIRSLENQTLRALLYAVGIRRRDALLKSIVQSSTDSIVCVDADGLIKTANPAAARLFRISVDRLIGTSLPDFLPSLPQRAEPAEPATFQRLADTLSECEARAEDGVEFPVELSVSRVNLQDETLYTAIIRDISERKAQHRQLQFQATHDPLTTLPNRPALAAHLDSRLAGSGRTDTLALMMIDLDRFKEVNDTLGHNVGDYVLHEVARRFEEVTRDRGFIARLGGDEFALVVDGFSDRQQLSTLAQALIECLRQPIETCGVAIDVGLSIGIAIYPDDACDAEALFKNSDVAMYVAKRSSSGFEYYDSANDRHSVRKLTIVTRLRQAIARSQLALHYQPQVELRSGRVESVEALVRWNDEVLGTVTPQEFIPLAETTDLIQPLSDWTLHEAIRQSTRWREQGIVLRVAVNLSARILQDANFPSRLAAMMAQAHMAPEQLELEITESAMMLDPDRALRIIRELGGLGLMLSIDDYGTGYSSLAYLRDLPVHALKLDRSFVSGMREREGDRVIVASTVQLAHALKLKLVAEGVECEEDVAILRDLGYDYAQGYRYSPALSAEALATWLQEFSASVGRYAPRVRAV